MYNRYIGGWDPFRPPLQNRPPQNGGLNGPFDLRGIRAALEKRLPFGLDLGDVTVLLILLLLYIDSGDEEFLLLLAILGWQMIRPGR